MQHTKTVEEFVRTNDGEFRAFVNSVCSTFNFPLYLAEDVVQEIYVKFLTTPLYDNYNPEYKLSTWLYPIVTSVILSHLRRNRVEAHRFVTPESDVQNHPDEPIDDVDIALRCCQVAREFQCVLDYNESVDGIDGLSARLREFEDKWLGDTGRNRKFKLVKRRDKNSSQDGCTLLDVYRLIDLGLSNRQIAQIYGCSNVFISSIKQLIVRALREFGVRDE
jgi:RNA polymerase sigma factor (sigma-70 family)